MSNLGQNKAILDSNRKCVVCATYQRKIDDVEQNLSGRDQIITILQGRLQKCETNYKNLLDEFEKLRFEHCTAVQDNYSLKKINAKLEEFDLKNKGNELRGSGSHSNRHICCNNPDSKRKYQEYHNSSTKEICHIESLVYSQNQVLKQLLDKIINELKSCNCDHTEASENINKIHDDFKSIESGDHLNADPKLIELSTQVESLKALLFKCQEENDRMKKLLQDKKNNFSECQNILEHTSRSIGKISNSIDDLVKFKSAVKKKSREVSCLIQDPVAIKMEEEKNKGQISELQKELEEKAVEQENYKYDMLGKMNDIAANNEVLSDTLEIIKAENKNNLDGVANLKEELKKVNEESELKQTEMKKRISQLESELEEHVLVEKKLRFSLEESTKETNALKQNLKAVQEDGTPNCQCDKCNNRSCKRKERLEELECAWGEMEKDLTEKSLELNEYEEENRALKQKIQCMANCNDILKKRLQQAEDELHDVRERQPATFDLTGHFVEEGPCLGDDCYRGQLEKVKEIERLSNTVQAQKEEIEELKRKNEELTSRDLGRATGHVVEEGRCLGDDCYRGQLEKVKEIERLNNTVQAQKEEIDELKRKNVELPSRDVGRVTGHVAEEGRCLGDDCYRGQLEKVKKIELLNNTVKRQEDEIKILSNRIAELSLGDLTQRSSNLIEKGRPLGSDCFCDHKQELSETEGPNDTVKTKDEEIRKLTDRIIELNKYEEENRALKQKIQCMNYCNGALKTRLKQADDALLEMNERQPGQLEKVEQIERLNNTVQAQKEEIEKLQRKNEELGSRDLGRTSGHVVEEVRCFGNECYRGQFEKVKEIEHLIDTVKRQKEEIEELKRKNVELPEPRNRNRGRPSDVVEEGRCLDDDCYRDQLEKATEIKRLNNTVQAQKEEIEELKGKNDERGFGPPEPKSSRSDTMRLNNILNMKDDEIKNLTKIIEELRSGDLKKSSCRWPGEEIEEEEYRCYCSKGSVEKERSGPEIDDLTDRIRLQKEEIKELQRENADLSTQIERLKIENKQETAKLQAMVNHSQRQVELLLKEHDEKTAQIQIVANELDGIRRSVTEENNNFASTIEDLKRERDDLKQKMEEYVKEGVCNCGSHAAELDKAKAELYKKQCVISELEHSIDSFNNTMKTFEQNIEALACENTSLRDDKEKQLKDLDNLRYKLKDKVTEMERIREQLETSQRTCECLSEECKNLGNENDKLKHEIDTVQREHDRTWRATEAEKLQLEIEVASLKEERNTASAIYHKLESTQKAYDDLRNQCAKKSLDNEKLQEEVQNKAKIIEELKAKAGAMQCECEKLKNKNRANIEEQYKIGQKMENLQECCEKITRQYTSKCLENNDLQLRVNENKKEDSQCSTNCDELKKKVEDLERELAEANRKCSCMQKEYDKNCRDMKMLKKQYDVSCKQSQISREEYNNLCREYKEIKKMLADQIKRYKKDTDSIDAGQSNQNKQCKLVNDLKRHILEKENEILGLQQKLKDSSYEIIELKDYIHKLISDNNILKSAINNLIGNLERKIKGPDTADAIAGEILQSLSTIESTIMKKSKNQYCPPTCNFKDCDCMSQIQSQYNKEFEQDNRRLSSEHNLNSGHTDQPVYDCNVTDRSCPAYSGFRPPNYDPRVDRTRRKESSCDHCAQGPSKSTVERKVPSSKNNKMRDDDCCDHNKSPSKCYSKNMRISSTNGGMSEMSTTDSEDCPASCNFLEKNSVDYLKDTIQGLKVTKDDTTNDT